MRAIRVFPNPLLRFQSRDSLRLLDVNFRKSFPRKINLNVSAESLFAMAPSRDYSSTIEQVKVTPWIQKVTGKDANTEGSVGSAKRRAWIALGGNLGDRVGTIEQACNEMAGRGIKVIRTSSLWETEPMYVLDQASFINGACEVETTLEPLALLDELQAIENSMGRKKVIDKGPRNIDLDILLYEDETFDHERLQIPHIGMPEREFVLRPLAEYVEN
jgi:2-amino-4-hydroxy-6-hydroxymethyldihydropteridine diphosphokinase